MLRGNPCNRNRTTLQIVYLGNGCEGYSPRMFLPAKNELTTHAQIESRKEYFLQFNYVYTPDRYIGLWWQFRTRLMSDKDARAFITQVAPWELWTIPSSKRDPQ